MTLSVNDSGAMPTTTARSTPTEGELLEDLARRLKAINTKEHRHSEFGQPMPGVYVEALVWIGLAAVIWVLALNFLA